MKQWNSDTGGTSWSTYRHQLEQYVHKVQGRQGSGVWIDGGHSIRPMEIIDGAYEKPWMPLRSMKSYGT